jgi:hypothetical protein
LLQSNDVKVLKVLSLKAETTRQMNEQSRRILGIKAFVLISALLLPVVLYAQDATPSAAEDSFLYLKVQLQQKVKPASLKPGDVVEGMLTRGVYWREKEVIPRGSRISLVVDHLEQRRRPPNDHWPWAIKAFAPRHEKYPTFRSAHVLLPDGRTMDLQVSLLSIAQRVVVRGNSRQKEPNSHVGVPDAPETSLTAAVSPEESSLKAKTSPEGLTANLRAFVNSADFPSDSGGQTSLPAAETMMVPAGMQAKLVLLDGVSASGSHSGDAFHARLLEPVSVGSNVVIPAGSIVEGIVAKAQKPRMLSRSGSLLLSFTSVSDGRTVKRIDASISSLSLDKRSHTRIDSEGEIQGDRPGLAWMLINLGMTGGLAKVADDSTQLIMESIISAATDVSTAGTSRIVAACVSGVFILTRHGRDVVLPKFSEIDITFNRPIVLSAVLPSGDHPDQEQSGDVTR